jgi:uncharacterized YccA/Bax inhibitor family protein
MHTSNPALSARTFAAEHRHAHRHLMTVNGAVAKTGILTGLLVAAGTVAWIATHPEGGSQPADRSLAMLFVLGGGLGGFLVALVTCFVPRISPFTAPVYAILEGLFLGTISGLVNEKYSGIALQAGLLTAGILGLMLMAYVTGVLRATPLFTKVVVLATLGLCLFYLGTWLVRLFVGPTALDAVYGNGIYGIGFSVLVVGLAALNLILDFDTIEAGARAGAPKYMEWYAAFGLLVTLVWLYLELLRLLAKIRSND